MTVPETPPLPDRVTRAAQSALEAIGILSNSYFQQLSSGQMTRTAFGRSQQRFYFAVVEFPRPMLCLMARLADPAQRLGMLDNVLEEHGHFDATRFHASTFRRFCVSLGVDDPAQQAGGGPAVDAFNLALWGVCQTAPPETALACLGVIEWAFAQISALIGRTVVGHGWVAADALVHYHLHAELDIDHAAAFFRPLELVWDDPLARDQITRGLALGAYAFDRLYRDLVEPDAAE